jgi:hypothetical protein
MSLARPGDFSPYENCLKTIFEKFKFFNEKYREMNEAAKPILFKF